MSSSSTNVPRHAAPSAAETRSPAVKDAKAPAHLAPPERIHLSAPHVGETEREALLAAFDSNWIAPVGPALDDLERKLCQITGADAAVGVVSGTAALHLALVALGVGPGDIVVVPSLTFVASANVVRYVGATPYFVDCDPASGNIDPHLLEATIRGLVNGGNPPAAVMTVDLYGSCADYGRIGPICARYGVPIVEDAAESIGATHAGRPAGSFGTLAAFSFNGNKLVTSGGGGALVGPRHMIERARKLAGQGRESALHFEHREIGYAYRLSNLLAAVASAQIDRVGEMMGRTREINHRYREVVDMIPGASLLDIDRDGHGNGWLSVLLLDQDRHRTPAEICQAMAADNIEARPAWKPMHLQELYQDSVIIGGDASEGHFASGLCLPSGSSITADDQERVIASLLAALTQPSDPSSAVIDLNPELDVRSEQPQQHLENPVASQRAA